MQVLIRVRGHATVIIVVTDPNGRLPLGLQPDLQLLQQQRAAALLALNPKNPAQTALQNLRQPLRQQVTLPLSRLITHPRCIIGAYEDSKIRMFDERRMIECFRAHEEAVMGLAARESDANGLWSCGQDAFVKYWDLRKLDAAVW
jgi:hypothetical protein